MCDTIFIEINNCNINLAFSYQLITYLKPRKRKKVYSDNHRAMNINKCVHLFDNH